MMNVKCARKHCGWRMCGLEHPSPVEFYVSCWQSNLSSLPLLIVRSTLFLYATCVLLASVIMLPLTLNVHIKYWFIYFTHWGVLLISVTLAFSTTISVYAYIDKPIGMHIFFIFSLLH